MDKIKKIDFRRGISKKTGRNYYRVDIYFKALDGSEYKKTFFMTAVEVMACGLKDSFH